MTFPLCRRVESRFSLRVFGLVQRQCRFSTTRPELKSASKAVTSGFNADARSQEQNREQLWQEIHTLESYLGLPKTRTDGRWREKRLLGKAAALFEQRMKESSSETGSSVPPDSASTAPSTPLIQEIYHASQEQQNNPTTKLPENKVVARRPPVSRSEAKETLPTRKKKRSKEASNQDNERPTRSKKDMEPWQIQKEALQKKFKDEKWAPRKRLSPDTIEGIRMLHRSDPGTYPTQVLSKQFEVSPEAIRRILKSKWIPNEEEAEKRRERWERRGERIWSGKVEMGVKPPKKWRVMGVGRVGTGETPKWKRKRTDKLEHVPWDNRSFEPEDKAIDQGNSISDQIL